MKSLEWYMTATFTLSMPGKRVASAQLALILPWNVHTRPSSQKKRAFLRRILVLEIILAERARGKLNHNCEKTTMAEPPKCFLVWPRHSLLRPFFPLRNGLREVDNAVCSNNKQAPLTETYLGIITNHYTQQYTFMETAASDTILEEKGHS